MGEIGKTRDYLPNIIPTHKSQLDFLHANEDSEIYKYGISNNVYRRLVKEHDKKFKYFDIKLLRESYRYQEVEYIITQELKLKKRLLKMDWDNRIQREITYFENENEKDWFKELVDDLVTSRYKQSQFVNLLMM